MDEEEGNQEDRKEENEDDAKDSVKEYVRRRQRQVEDYVNKEFETRRKMDDKENGDN